MKGIDTSNDVLDGKLDTFASSDKEQNPSLFIMFNEEILLNKLIIQLNPENTMTSPYRISIVYKDPKKSVNFPIDLDETIQNDHIAVFPNLESNCRYIRITRPMNVTDEKEFGGGVKISIANIYAYAKTLKTISPDSEVQETIKNERAICNIMKKNMTDKAYTELQDKIRQTEMDTISKTQQNILNSINSPKLIITWDNVNLVGNKLKLELLRKEFLHISGIQVFGTSTNNYDIIDKDWVSMPETTITMSSVYEDENNIVYDSSKCRDNNLDTYCRTMNTVDPYPFILLTLSETINISKIIIFNRKDKNQNRLLPCKISVLNNKNQVLMTATKNKFGEDLIYSKRIEDPPTGCLSMNQLKITDIGDIDYFRGWTDVEGTGNKCNYCRVVGEGLQRTFACASSTGSNEFEFTTTMGRDLGEKNTMFMKDVYGSNKDDLCFCKKDSSNQSHIECLINETDENNNSGFTKVYNPPSGKNCLGQDVDQLQQNFGNTVMGKDKSIKHRIDTGFYSAKEKAYYLFKNSTLDNKEIVLYIKMDLNHRKVESAKPMTNNAGNGTWPNLDNMFITNIDTVYTDGNENIYITKGTKLTKYDLSKKIQYEGYPREIREEYPNFPFSTIDEAYYAGNNQVFFFNQGKYIQFDISQPSKNSHLSPNTIKLGGWNMTFDAIDCAVSFYDKPDEEKILFCRNEKYFFYNEAESGNDMYNIENNLVELYNNLWEINMNSLLTTTVQVDYERDSIPLPVQLATVKKQQGSRQSILSDGSQNSVLTSNNDSSVKPLPFNTIVSNNGIAANKQLELVRKLNKPSKFKCNNKSKLSNDQIIKFTNDILESGSLSQYLKNSQMNLNSLACEINKQPKDIAIAASNGVFINKKKIMTFLVK